MTDATLRERVLRLLDAATARSDGLAPIARAGHPALRTVATRYDGQLADDELTALLALMHRTMRGAPGVGLAAPQVGLAVALAVVEDPGAIDPEVAEVRERVPVPYRVLVNPRYEAVGDERAAFYEGCLSVVGYQAVVPRARQVRLTGADERGETLDEVLTGWSARIVAHETDHLAGVLYVDRAELRSLTTTDDLGASWAGPARPTRAAQVLGFPLG